MAVVVVAALFGLAVLDHRVRAAAEVEAQSVGLPLGVQLVARPWCEGVLLAAMRRLEELARAQSSYPSVPVTP